MRKARNSIVEATRRRGFRIMVNTVGTIRGESLSSLIEI